MPGDIRNVSSTRTELHGRALATILIAESGTDGLYIDMSDENAAVKIIGGSTVAKIDMHRNSQIR